jgi:hypothetical protein
MAGSGVPVIELLPRGSDDLLPAAAWNLYGAATSLPELILLLEQALNSTRRHNQVSPFVFAGRGAKAVQATVDALLASRPLSPAEDEPQNCLVAAS